MPHTQEVLDFGTGDLCKFHHEIFMSQGMCANNLCSIFLKRIVQCLKCLFPFISDCFNDWIFYLATFGVFLFFLKNMQEVIFAILLRANLYFSGIPRGKRPAKEGVVPDSPHT